MKRLTAIVALTAALLLTASAAAISGPSIASAGAAAAPPLYKNCTALNKKYPHGVGKVGARDKTSGTPVTNFKRSNSVYRTAMSHNKGLDRDKDGIACEKK